MDSNGKESIIRGKVKVTPEATGAVPQITDITADKTMEKVGQNVTYTYEGRLGEGKASRGLEINRP